MAKEEIHHHLETFETAGSTLEMKNTKGIDDASKFMRERGAITWTEEEERKLLRKIDFRLVPFLFFSCLITYMDSQGFGLSAIFGMIEDLKLYSIISLDPVTISTSKYSWCSSIPAFGALVATYPLLILAQHVPLGKFAGATTLWSGFFALMMIVIKDFKGAMVTRFLYGWQSVGTPTFVIISVMWWKTDEQPLRIAMWYAGAPFGGLIGQAFDYAAVHIKGKYEKSPWKWIYVVLGSISIGYTVLFLVFFPDSPMKAKFLTDRERQIAVQRVEMNNTGIQTRKFKSSQIVDALKDPQLYLITLVLFSFAFANNCIGSFAALLLTNFGYTTFNAIKLLMPASGVIMVVMFLSGVAARRWPRRRITIAMICIVPTIIGNAILWKIPRSDKKGILGGLYICVFFYGSYIQVLSLIAANVAGHTKKTTVNAAVSVLSCVGGILGPFTFKGEEASKGYPTGIGTLLGLVAFSELLLIVLLLHYRRMNRIKQDYLLATPGESSQTELAFLDLTDRENPHFIYSY